MTLGGANAGQFVPPRPPLNRRRPSRVGTHRGRAVPVGVFDGFRGVVHVRGTGGIVMSTACEAGTSARRPTGWPNVYGVLDTGHRRRGPKNVTVKRLRTLWRVMPRRGPEHRRGAAVRLVVVALATLAAGSAGFDSMPTPFQLVSLGVAAVLAACLAADAAPAQSLSKKTIVVM